MSDYYKRRWGRRGERVEKKLTVDGGQLMGKLMEDGGKRVEKKLTIDGGRLMGKLMEERGWLMDNSQKKVSS